LIDNDCLENESASQSPSAPPDYIRILPPSARSSKLIDFFSQIQRDNPVPIRFMQSDLSIPNLAGQTSFLTHETVIRYSETWHTELEDLLAHELGHVLLRQRGLSMEVAVVRSQSPFFQALATSISSAVEDFLIAKMMLEKGFRPQVVWEHLAQNLLHPQPISPEIKRGDGFQRAAGLRLFAALDLRKLFEKDVVITSEQLEAAAAALNPGIVLYERAYFKALGTLDCTDVLTCFNKTSQLRDIVGFSQIAIRNPSTKKFE
jgi:hypothetical protein